MGEPERTASHGANVADTFHPERGPSYEEYQRVVARARVEEPVFHWPTLDAWVVTRYDDVYRVLTDSKTFHQSGSHEVANRYPPEVLEILDSGPAPWTTTALFSSADGEEHARLRGCMSRTFTPRRVVNLEPRIREIVMTLIDAFVDNGKADFVRQFAFPLPVRVIVEFLGLPIEDADQLRTWSDDMTRLFTARLDSQEQCFLARQVVEFQRYAERALLERRDRPRDDYITRLVQAADSGASRVTMAELVHILTDGLIIGGHETTKGALANGLWHLLSVRERWDDLVSNPTKAEDIVEELLRIEPPQNGFFRVVGEPVELSGVRLEPGASVYWLSSSANHDEERFAEPEEFRCGRPKVPPMLTFGQGAHYCIGAPLARAEMRIAFEELARRLPGLRLEDPFPPFLHNAVLRHLTTLPIGWDVPGR